MAISTDRAIVSAHVAESNPLAIQFLEPSPRAALVTDGANTTRIHRIRYGDARDATHVPAYDRIAIIDLHPGIDVVFHGTGRALEFDVVVAPHADPSTFAFRIDGAQRVTRNEEGDLVIVAGESSLVLEHPIAYQDIDDVRRNVPSEFALGDNGVVRMRVGEYDATHTLVIDPLISYATYLGGANSEQGLAIAVDAAGNAYVAGYTSSTDFPLVNPYDGTLARKGVDTDVFVSKLNASGTALVWSTFIGGPTGTDRAVGIAVDASGAVYVTGQTSGTDFPTTAGAWQKAPTGGGGFVAKLAPTGNALVYSTYIAAATPSSIAVDSSGNAYVAGSATSSFVTTSAALRTVSGVPAGSTGFVLKLNAGGSAPVYSTFLGGSAGEDATSIAVDAYGNAYIGGWTTSSDFPVLNAFQSARGAGKDGFVAKLASDGASLVYATLLGGVLDDAVNAIAVDREGHAYVAGETYSGNFPVKDGFQMFKSGRLLVNSSVGNAFVAKLEAAGNALVYASFLGGEVCQSYCQTLGGLPQYPADAAYAIAIDDAGHPYVGGLARSYTFPLFDSSAPRKQMDNQDSAFVTKIAVTGRSLLWSTFLRTGFGEYGTVARAPMGAVTGLAVDPAGNAFATGDADSDGNFVPTQGAFQTTSTYGPAAIITKFPAAQAMTLATSNDYVDAQTPITVTATLSGPLVSGSVNFMRGGTWIGSGVLSGNKASVVVTLPAGIHLLSATLGIAGNSTDTIPVVQIVDVPLTCSKSTAAE
ncbi:MAG TPA: SBBP repeat-containing protein [Casimicrobiaceae bacterium]|nr:SBBP repeat-containing protein [Casimicrobiaceae bacterium]